MHSIPFERVHHVLHIYWNKYGISSIEVVVLSEKGSISLRYNLNNTLLFQTCGIPLIKKVSDDFMKYIIKVKQWCYAIFLWKNNIHLEQIYHHFKLTKFTIWYYIEICHCLYIYTIHSIPFKSVWHSFEEVAFMTHSGPCERVWPCLSSCTY